MKYRQATEKDIEQMMNIRNSVNENILSDPSLVTYQICLDYLELLGHGWVCESKTRIIGFSYAAINNHSIWALFVLPEFENQGIGKQLLGLATDWLFEKGAPHVTLETEAHTRADKFYHSQGWHKGTVNEKGDVMFTLSKEQAFIKRKKQK